MRIGALVREGADTGPAPASTLRAENGTMCLCQVMQAEGRYLQPCINDAHATLMAEEKQGKPRISKHRSMLWGSSRCDEY